jgi:hypothetical protein
MGIFDNVTTTQVKEAQYFERGNFIRPGLYVVEVSKVKEGRMRAPKNTGFFVAEMKVLETSEPKLHPVGSTMAWMATADKDAFLGNVKHFVSAAGNMGLEEVDVEMMKMAVSEENPLAGIVMRAEAVNVKTKADKDFTRVRFTWIADTVADVPALDA